MPKAVRRAARLCRKLRVYSEANGATDGSIIAVIISTQTTAKDPIPRPIVPGIGPM